MGQHPLRILSLSLFNFIATLSISIDSSSSVILDETVTRVVILRDCDTTSISISIPSEDSWTGGCRLRPMIALLAKSVSRRTYRIREWYYRGEAVLKMLPGRKEAKETARKRETWQEGVGGGLAIPVTGSDHVFALAGCLDFPCHSISTRFAKQQKQMIGFLRVYTLARALRTRPPRREIHRGRFLSRE